MLTLISSDVLNYTYNEITVEEYINILWNVTVSPILVINIIALIICSIKGYWIEKYNNGKDITEAILSEKDMKM